MTDQTGRSLGASASIALWQPTTLTDSRNDITYRQIAIDPGRVNPWKRFEQHAGTIELVVDSGNESRRVRFLVPSYTPFTPP